MNFKMISIWAAMGLGVPLHSAVAADAIKIGSVLSVTGGTSFLGEPEEKTLRMYVDEFNKKGGVAGRQIELIVYDDGSDANKARTFATRLVEEDKIVAMIGGSSTGTSMAMVPVFEDAKIPFISFAGGLEIVDPVKRYVFKTPHTDRMACQKIFGDLKARGFSKIGMISGTDGFGASMRRQCLSLAGQYGMEIVGDESYGPKDSDMTAQLTKLRGTTGLQAIINAGTGQGPAIIARNHAQLGMAIPLYANQGVASRSYIDLAGAAANGVRLPSAALLVADKLPDNDPQKGITMKYKTEYEAATGKPVSTFGGQSYDGLRILLEAIERAKSADPEAIRDEIERTKDFIGTAGHVTMTASDHMGLDLESFRMLEIQNGDWTLVK